MDLSRGDDDDVKCIFLRRYFTPHGNATLTCGGDALPITTVQSKYDNEIQSIAKTIPEAEIVLNWAREFVRNWQSAKNDEN
jgi:hypothetical protein